MQLKTRKMQKQYCHERVVRKEPSPDDRRRIRSTTPEVCANRRRRNLQRNETTNENWDAESKPILEAFWHAKYFIKMIRVREGSVCPGTRDWLKILGNRWLSRL
jgi:hypothetical protein